MRTSASVYIYHSHEIRLLSYTVDRSITMTFIYKLCLGLAFVVYVSAFDVDKCSEYTDCSSCSSAQTTILKIDCVWCPLSRKCHPSLSKLTPCLKYMLVNDPSECPAVDSASYNAEFAYMGINLAAATYTGGAQKCLDAIFPEPKFQVKDTFAVRCDDTFSEYDDCSGYTAVSTDEKLIVVAFRGSKTNEQVLDQILTRIVGKDDDFIAGGKVSRYYNNAAKNMYPCVRESLSELMTENPSYRILVLGHSLGAALASLTAAMLVYDNIVSSSNLDLYTFGMPRVGDKDFAYNFDKLVESSWVVIRNRDFVPHFPPCPISCQVPFNGPFHHKRQIFYPNLEMNVSSPYITCQGNEEYSCSNELFIKEPCFNMTECFGIHRVMFGVVVPDVCDLTTGTIPEPWDETLTYQCVSIPEPSRKK